MAFIIDASQVIGSYGDAGGTVESLELDAISFEQGVATLLRIAGQLENTEAPMRAAKRIAIEDMKERFDNQESPDGQAWFELEQNYADRKQSDVGFVEPKLTRDGNLRRAATNSDAWTVGPDSLWFSTEDLPEYWPTMNFGSSDMEGHDIIHHQEFVPGKGSVNSGKRSAISNQMRTKNPSNIAPRPFIGISSKAEEEILNVFDIWFDEAISKSIVITKSGTLQTRGAGGRFGPKPIIG